MSDIWSNNFELFIRSLIICLFKFKLYYEEIISHPLKILLNRRLWYCVNYFYRTLNKNTQLYVNGIEKYLHHCFLINLIL